MEVDQDSLAVGSKYIYFCRGRGDGSVTVVAMPFFFSEDQSSNNHPGQLTTACNSVPAH